MDNLKEMLTWLKENGGYGFEDNFVEFKHTVSGLGCFARKDFAVGDDIFVIPSSCIINSNSVQQSPIVKALRDFAQSQINKKLLTSELLIWVFMHEQLEMGGHFGSYLRTLDSHTPNLLSWSQFFYNALEGTNLHSSIASTRSSLEEKIEFVKACLDHSNISATTSTIAKNINWAYGHYVSRRYPDKFSTLGNQSNELTEGREEGMGEVGSMCPLLDILNHQSGTAWLKLEARSGSLHVICNHPRSKVSVDPKHNIIVGKQCIHFFFVVFLVGR